MATLMTDCLDCCAEQLRIMALARLTAKLCATSRPASRHSKPSSITRAFENRWLAPDRVHAKQRCPEHLRRIRLNDAIPGKTPVFAANQVGFPALTFYTKYKDRWSVERVNPA